MVISDFLVTFADKKLRTKMNKKTYVSPEVRSHELRTAGGLMGGSPNETVGTMQNYTKQTKQTWETDETDN